MKLSFPQLPKRWRTNGGLHSESIFSFLPTPPPRLHPPWPEQRAWHSGLPNVLGAREEVRGSYTMALEKAPGEVQITHVCALSTSPVPLAS